MNRLVLLMVGVSWFCATTVLAANGQLPKPAALPIEVTAQQLEADQQQRQAIFSGEVVAKQGDITLYSDKLIVYSLPEQDQVERLEAFGHVRVVQQDRTATADRAIYRQLEDTLVLYGHAQVHQGQNQVQGDEITVYLKENRSIVKSGATGERVKAVLFPKQKPGQQ